MFIVSAVITIVAGISAKFILEPMRARFIESHNEPQGALAVAGHGNGNASRMSHWPEQSGE